MKKIITILAVIGMFGFQACTGPEGPPGQDGLIGEVYELKNEDFGYNVDDGYNISRTFGETIGHNIYAADVILIYRLSGTIDSSTPIWQLIPRTFYLAQGELDYDFDFSKEDFKIYARGTYDLELTPQYLDDQTFRIIVVPAEFASTVNVNNYLEVINALNLNENKVQKINF